MNLLTGTLQDYNLKGILRPDGMYAAYESAKKKKLKKKKTKKSKGKSIAKILIEVDVKVE